MKLHEDSRHISHAMRHIAREMLKSEIKQVVAQMNETADDVLACPSCQELVWAYEAHLSGLVNDPLKDMDAEEAFQRRCDYFGRNRCNLCKRGVAICSG